ncbi:hypothetical protein GCM10009837_87680 [Streptomyces durmitorensis]|uniref:AfsR/SARP family transcriptional regulator n=1 Tax=Streptomyces durmitorensis TaxID=319947 RepID=A0ABY4QAC6_9ACTN|nr:AfsR/SARP family transcriptional regulator [Streptomyces durmitorensis]UQT61948.1 AfsR/SARP family transcriptional regulator [Streptomyces durmitorensis]
MKIQVLGPLRAEVNGGSIVPTAGKPRQLLSLLALYRGRVVPVQTLMEEIWAVDPPLSSLTTLQTYILQLRRRLGTAMGPDVPGNAKDILATRHGGYVLQTPADCIDVHQYEQRVAEGRTAFEAGDAALASDRFRAALDLWDGSALVDVRLGPVLDIEVVRLEESRLVTTERRIDADLRLGRHAELLGEMRQLTMHHPLHEGLHAQFILAQYRSGRQADALGTYRGLCVRLREELGVEPAPQLQRLYQAMLTTAPRLDVLAGPRGASTFDLFAA